MTQLSNAFLRRRELDQLKQEELEDLEYHLQYRRKGLLQKLEQLNRDLLDIESDRQKVVQELSKRGLHA
ncbi:hypothetical protein [Tumebacillus flagellatus]|uniref:Uncharacterized protein n=1 Tax=Tumebacillus flagellatus TaxID=1157490 RepID=A0A074MCM8_9BACL|nr:hypothetical protein [Tumebacillus flagellatus]KEO83607.1 hypothetical protein EL26_09350 [Tumebacillus flagellatus]